MELRAPRVWARICEGCGRRDEDPMTLERGLCASCAQRLTNGVLTGDFPVNDALDAPAFTDRIVCALRDGMWATNVPRLVVHHSPDGWAWGYGGSGPADLALNLCEGALRVMVHGGPVMRCHEGTCFTAAWAMHQTCKERFVAPMAYEGGEIPFAALREWVAAQIGSAVHGIADLTERAEDRESRGPVATHPESDAWELWREEEMNPWKQE